jgi:UDP-N-acetyl-D-glucosamine dehydrogenase
VKGAEVSYHDPFVREAVIGGERLTSVPLSDSLIEDQDAVAILTAHSGIDHRRVVDIASLVFDARGVTKPLQRANLVRL